MSKEQKEQDKKSKKGKEESEYNIKKNTEVRQTLYNISNRRKIKQTRKQEKNMNYLLKDLKMQTHRFVVGHWMKLKKMLVQLQDQ